jgi:signal transduction histidine kinase
VSNGFDSISTAAAADARLRARIAGLLDLALRPLLAADALRPPVAALLRTTASLPLPGVAASAELRHALVAAARALLDVDDAEAMLSALDFRQRRSSLARGMLDRLGDATSVETGALDELEAGKTRSLLAEDAVAFADAPLAELRDAQRLVRVVAVATQGATDPEAGRRAAEALLEFPAGAFEELLVRAWADAEPAPGSERSFTHEQLAARVDVLLRLQRSLGALDGETDARRRRAHVLALARSELDATVGLALAESDEHLALRGLGDLDGTRVQQSESGSLAARALLAGEVFDQPIDASAAVVDRQIARRLDTDVLRAIPMFAPEPVGVLLVPATVDEFLALGLAALAAPGLWLPIRFEQRIEEVGRSVQNRYDRRLREVVHEANNPLSVIHNYLHVLGARLDDENTSREQLRLIGEEIGRTSQILRALVDAPAGPEAKRPVQPGPTLHALVSDVLALLEPSLIADAGIELVAELDSVDVTPALDSAQLRQVLLNLIKNAVEAMPDGGRIVVATHTALATSTGPGFEISITDSGAGIPPDLLRGLFSRGTSTKGEGRGLGLGIVRQLVEALGGSVSAQSQPGRGTTFRLVFPLH